MTTYVKCESWWASTKHFDYLHKCELPESHEENGCRCRCGKTPHPKNYKSVAETRKLAALRRAKKGRK